MVLLLAAACDADLEGGPPALSAYPPTPYDSTAAGTYHDTTVADPYRWLENDTASLWRRWVTDQRALTDAFLGKIPYRPLLDTRLRQLWNFERYSVPIVRDSFFFIYRNAGLQPRDVLYRTTNPSGGAMTIALDPAMLGPGLDLVSGTARPSADGNKLAFEVTSPEPGWNWVLVKDLRTEAILDDTLRGIRSSDISWWGDGFFYCRFPDPEPGQPQSRKVEFQQLYYHRLGTPQEEDELVFADRTNPELIFSARTTADERFLLLQFGDRPTGISLYLRDLAHSDPALEPIVEDFRHSFTVIGSWRQYLYVLTDYKAPRQRLLRVDIRRPAPRYWKELVPEDAAFFLTEVHQAAGHLFAVYIQNASHRVRIYDREGVMLKELELPGPGIVTAVEGGPADRRVFLGFSSLMRPATVFEVNLTDFTVLAHRTPTFSFDADAFVLRQVWLQSSDTASLPMFILHHRGVALNGRAPTLIMVDGRRGGLPAFNISGWLLLPAILENGGIVAVPAVRQGWESGAARQAAVRDQQQLAVDDLLAAAEYLVVNRYTTADRLAVCGKDAGATVAAAALLERPDLFGVGLFSGGAYDLLRYQHFSTDWKLKAVFGRSDERGDFGWLLPLSPLHRVKPENYPSVLIDAGSGPDAISPVHACKLAAAMQSHQQGRQPILLRMPPPGATASNPTVDDRIAAGADLLSFMFSQMQFDPIYERLE